SACTTRSTPAPHRPCALELRAAANKVRAIKPRVSCVRAEIKVFFIVWITGALDSIFLVMRCRSAGALFHCHQDLSVDAILGEIDLPGYAQIKANCTCMTDVVDDVGLIQFCLHHRNHL